MAFHFRDGLDPEPFLAWVREVVATFDGDITAAARHLGFKDSTSVARWLNGKQADGRPLVKIRLGQVDRICTRAGVPLSLLYPEPEDDEPCFDHYCTHCKEWTVTGADRVCLWCADEPAVRPRGVANVCPRCNGHKHHGSKVCRSCRTLDPPRRKPVNVSQEVLAEAQRMWQNGMSLRSVAYKIFDRTKYHHPETCYSTLRVIARRDWTREKVAA